MIKLYGTTRSRAFRCLWMLEECGLEYALVETKFGTADVQRPDFVALNPNAKVPVLVDGPVVLWESLAINHYLARTYGDVLYPERAAELVQWTCWLMGELEGPHDVANRTGGSVDLEVLDNTLEALRVALQDRAYLLSADFSVADLNACAVLLRPQYRPVVAADQVLQGWFSRCRERPALARAMDARAASSSKP